MMAATLASHGDKILSGIPLRRIGREDDIAGACIYLSSKAASFVNGATITLDGGSLVSPRI